jgi:hypothetical protein
MAPSLLALLVSLSAAGGTAYLIVSRHRILAGFAALVSAVGLLAAVKLAEADGQSRSVFFHGVMDRVFDAAILAPLAWISRTSSLRITALALIGLGAANLASYERARGGALGYRTSDPFGYQAARVALLVAALLTGWVEAGLWAFVALTVAASAVRAWNVAVQDRRAREAALPR